jgi:transcriptional regulator with XRE-family HTH domain
MLEIGRRAREIRETRRLMQKEVSKRAGIPPSTISRIEIGDISRPSAELVYRLARGLGVDPGELFKAPKEPFTTTEGVQLSPLGTPVLLNAFGVGRGEGFAKPSLNDALSQLRILTADWERGGLTDEDLVEGVGQIHKRLRQLVASGE